MELRLVKTTKFMTFHEQTPRLGKHPVIDVHNRRSMGLLGQIVWYTPWRQFCFFPEPNTVFNDSCMNDIISFMHELAAAAKLNQKQGQITEH